ncbi:MAG: hypothetical protein AAF789_08580 [Bacteroidota bacterium]
MQDNFKDYIDSNREDFEIYPFDADKEWNGLSKKILPKKRKIDRWKVTAIASCILLVLLSTIHFLNPADPVNNEVAELEQYYTTEINHKVSLIKDQLENDAILKDLEAMNGVFAELKADLKDNVDNEEVISAMMENYRLKLQILEEILGELERENAEKSL